MTAVNFTKKLTNQRGVSLIEAMVAMLILAILFLGIAQVLARGLVSQRYMNTQNLAVLEMRERLQQNNEANLCSNPGNLSWLGNVELAINCNKSEVIISVDSISMPITANSITLFTTENTVLHNMVPLDAALKIPASVTAPVASPASKDAT